jgi:hypothetical protein
MFSSTVYKLFEYPVHILSASVYWRLHFLVYIIPASMIDSENKFSSPPTPFETHGRNDTVCPANICCYYSNTFSVTEMLSAYYTA